MNSSQPRFVSSVAIAQSVQVEMKDGGARRRVPMHERERRARHVVRDAVAAADRLDERRLPGAELTARS